MFVCVCLCICYLYQTYMFTYISADNLAVACSGLPVSNISCQSNQVIAVQRVMYGAVCTFNKASCITDRLSAGQVYLNLAEPYTLDGIREKCNGRNECHPELYASSFLGHLCKDSKYEANDVRVYFTCQQTKYRTTSWMTGKRSKLYLDETLTDLLFYWVIYSSAFWLIENCRIKGEAVIAGGQTWTAFLLLFVCVVNILVLTIVSWTDGQTDGRTHR